jgi:hypothetical protein
VAEKLKMVFKVYLNGKEDFYIKNSETMFSHYSFSFDLIFKEYNPKLKDLKNFTVKAFLTSDNEQIIKDISEITLGGKNANPLKTIKQSAAITFQSVKCKNSTFILGSYDKQHLAFLTVSMTYLDLML